MKYRILLLLIVLCSTSFNAQNKNEQPKIIIDSTLINDLNETLKQTQSLLKEYKLVTSEKLVAHEKKIIEKIDSQNSFWKTVLGLLPVFVVIIAAFFALLQVRFNLLTKRKIERLQILKEDISKYLSLGLNMVYLVSEAHTIKDALTSKNNAEDEKYKIVADKFEQAVPVFMNVTNSVVLELNHSDRTQNTLIELIKDFDDLFNKELSMSNPDFGKKVTYIEELKNKLTDQGRLVLEEGWEDAKSFKDFWPKFKKKKTKKE
ncbi:MAG: hypothetical protein HRT69_17630 [Flavobacteriaceae bacterium]|nr:hypothetical protein [Flavobacteriaceae bacterium]